MQTNRDDLIQENMNLVYYVLHKSFPTFAKDEDMVQEGMIGLIKAANTYQDGKGKFSTYAYRCIFNTMASYLQQQKCDVDIISLDSEVKGKDDSASLIHELIEDVESSSCFNLVEYDIFYNTLTPRQKQVFDRVKEGKKRQEIADEFGITNQAVTDAVKKIRKKWRLFSNEYQN